MNKLISFSLLMGISFPVIAASASHRIRVAEMESYREEAALPPNLFIKVKKHCYETVVRGLRHDEIEPDGTVVIHAGALLRRDLYNPCSQGPTLVEIKVGSTFSGRPYEVLSFEH